MADGDLGVEALPEAVIVDIDRALLDGKKIEAVKRYRQATNASLAVSLQAIDKRATQIGAVAIRTSSQNWRTVITIAAAIAATLAAELYLRHHP